MDLLTAVLHQNIEALLDLGCQRRQRQPTGRASPHAPHARCRMELCRQRACASGCGCAHQRSGRSRRDRACTRPPAAAMWTWHGFFSIAARTCDPRPTSIHRAHDRAQRAVGIQERSLEVATLIAQRMDRAGLARRPARVAHRQAGDARSRPLVDEPDGQRHHRALQGTRVAGSSVRSGSACGSCESALELESNAETLTETGRVLVRTS